MNYTIILVFIYFFTYPILQESEMPFQESLELLLLESLEESLESLEFELLESLESELLLEMSQQEMVEIEKMRRDAFRYVLDCSAINVPVNYEDIIWELFPDKEIERTNNDITIAEYIPQTKTIRIAYQYRNVSWVAAHEILHALGVVNHGVQFANCNLLANQNLIFLKGNRSSDH